MISQDAILSFLMWACGVLGGGLIGSLLFIALGVMKKLEKIEAIQKTEFDTIKLEAKEQFGSFGRQLASVHTVVMENIHEHEVRLVRLEEWRKARDTHAAPIASD